MPSSPARLPLSAPSEGKVLPSPPSACLQSKYAPSHRKLTAAPEGKGLVPSRNLLHSQGNGPSCHAQAGQRAEPAPGTGSRRAGLSCRPPFHSPSLFMHSQGKDGLIFRSSGGCLYPPRSAVNGAAPQSTTPLHYCLVGRGGKALGGTGLSKEPGLRPQVSKEVAGERIPGKGSNPQSHLLSQTEHLSSQSPAQGQV